MIEHGAPGGADTGDDPPLVDEPATVLGVLEDDRLRAVVTTTANHTVVTLQGHLDRDAAPVLDELLAAVDRWHSRAGRHARRGPVDRGDDRTPLASQGPTLWLDTRSLEDGDDLGWDVLAGHRERWLRDHGPCVTWPETIPQGSSR